MKKVITYGTYDLFHIGHVQLLKRLKEKDNYIIVGVSTDEFNAVKGKKSIFSYDERKAIVESCKYVDLVIPENSWEQKPKDRSGPRFSDMTLSDWSVLIVPKNTGTDYD